MSDLERILRVQVAGLSISEPRITVRVQRHADATQATGSCAIYNLSPAHSDQIYERSAAIDVEAGYPGRVASIFRGQVQRVQRASEALAHVTYISMGDMLADAETLGGWTERSYDGPVLVRHIVQDFAADMGYGTGPLDNIPLGVLSHDWAFSGPSAEGLTDLLEQHGLTWYEDDGLVRVGGDGTLQPDAANFLMTPETGMVRSPTPTDEGMEVVSFLNPLIRISSVLTVRSAFVSGDFKVVSLTHDADNWSGPFVTRCDTRSVTEEAEE